MVVQEGGGALLYTNMECCPASSWALWWKCACTVQWLCLQTCRHAWSCCPPTRYSCSIPCSQPREKGRSVTPAKAKFNYKLEYVILFLIILMCIAYVSTSMPYLLWVESISRVWCATSNEIRCSAFTAKIVMSFTQFQFHSSLPFFAGVWAR